MNDIFDLKGKTAIVTGASSGLGRHFAKTLSAAGANLVICARRLQNLEDLRKEIDGEVLVLPLDVTSEESVLDFYSEVKKSVGSADILINNAGTSDPKRFKDLDEQSWKYVLETNLNGAYRVAKNFTDSLIEEKKGKYHKYCLHSWAKSGTESCKLRYCQSRSSSVDKKYGTRISQIQYPC